MEEQIIAALLEADDIEKEIKQTTENYSKEEAQYQKEKEVILQRQQECQNRLRELEKRKEELIGLIAQEQIALYYRIAEKKSGIAIS